MTGAAMVLVVATGQQRGGELPDSAPVSVAVVGSRTEAELIVGLLLSHGLKAAVATDDAGGQEPQLHLQGIRVKRVADARQLPATPGPSP